MKRSANGSVLLIVFFILTTLVIWATNLLRTTSYMNNIAHAKQRYEQQFRLAEGLLEYGIGAVKLLYKHWHNELSSQAVCTFAQWPTHDNSELLLRDDSYSGKITITKKDKQIQMHAQLFKKNAAIIGLRCTLKEHAIPEHIDDDNQAVFIIIDWSLDER